LNQLSGLPCNSGTDAGTVVISYDPNTHAVSMVCRPTDYQPLTVLFDDNLPARSVPDAVVSVEGAASQNPPGFVNCVHNAGTACQAQFRLGTSVVLQADVTGPYARFDHWVGCDSVSPGPNAVPDCATTVTAGGDVIFAIFRPVYDATVSIVGRTTLGATDVFGDPGEPSGGFVRSSYESGGSICYSWNSACGMYADSKAVTFTAVSDTNPSFRAVFDHWTGACAGQGAVCTLNGVSGDVQMTAVFDN
jgi:hypothetical protein